jgi:hypothetical protein
MAYIQYFVSDGGVFGQLSGVRGMRKIDTISGGRVMSAAVISLAASGVWRALRVQVKDTNTVKEPSDSGKYSRLT